jgi:hypothetical protein
MFDRLAHHVATGFLANDWLPHIDFAGRVQFWPPGVNAPQFLFHVTTRVVALPPFIDLRTAAAIVGTAAAAGTGAVVTWFFHRRIAPGGRTQPLPVAFAASVWVLFAELPQVLFARGAALDYRTFNMSVHQWGTPTTVMVEALQILWFVAVVRVFSDEPTARRTRVLVPVLGVFTALALPALTLALPPGLFVWLWRGGRLGDRWRDALRLVWGPVAITLIVQLAIAMAWIPESRQAGLTIVAFGALRNLHGVGAGLGVFVLPVLWFAAGRGELKGNREMALVGWSLLIAMIALFSVAETGARASEGNVGRVAFGVATIGYLYLVRWAISLGLSWRGYRAWPLREQIVGPLLAVYGIVGLAGGILLYLEQIGLIVFTGVSV